MDTTKAVDVRQVPPPERHPLIFGTFEALETGEALELINDHDPMPLHLQFSDKQEGRFTWVYLERGPKVWKVRIGKVAG